MVMPRPRTFALLPLLALVLAAPLEAQRADTLRLALLWSVIEGQHPRADSLGALSGVAMDANGIVYVSDRAEHRIWVFGARGESLPTLGREGQGPGEFLSPTGIALGPEGKLYVRDQQHVTRFGADPATRRLTRYETSYFGGAFNDWMSTLATRFDAQGRLYYPKFNQGGLTTTMGQWMIFTPAGERVDSITVPFVEGAPPAWASVRLSRSDGRVLRGLNHVPFAALPKWDVSPRGTVLYTNGRDYVIREVDRRGALVREYRRAGPAIRIPDRERRDSLAALRRRVDSVSAIPRTQITGVPDEVWALRVPEAYPPIRNVFAAPDGLVWVRRWVPNGDRRTVFDVFEADGRFRTVVELPANILTDVTPVLTLDAIVAVGVDAETGAHTVLRFGRRR